MGCLHNDYEQASKRLDNQWNELNTDDNCREDITAWVPAALTTQRASLMRQGFKPPSSLYVAGAMRDIYIGESHAIDQMQDCESLQQSLMTYDLQGC